MKNLLFSFLTFLAFLPFGTSQVNFGVGTTFVIEGTTLGFQGKGIFNLSEKWRVGPTFNYYLESGSNWSIDGDVQYELLDISGVHIYPVAGISFIKFPGSDDIGINAGIFSDFPIADDAVRIYVEPKYRVSNGSSFVLSAGVLF